MSFLSLFIPILLFIQLSSSGYDERKSLILVGVAFLLVYITHAILTMFVSKINAKFGTKISFLISQVFYILFLIFINYAKEVTLILISFILWGVAAGFWWLTYHTFFLEVGNIKEFGKEISVAEVLGIGSGLIGPLIAGIILTYMGKGYLFHFALLVTAVSLVCIVLMKDFERLESVTIDDIIIQVKKRKREFLAFIGVSAEEVIYTVAWPLLLFIIFKNYLAVGGFSSLVILISAFAAYITGRLIDRFAKGKLEKLGAGVVASAWFGKALTQNPTGIFFLDAVYRVFANFFYLPITAIAYDHAILDGKTKYLVFREIAYKIGNAIGLLFFIFFAILNLPFWFVFIITAFFALIPMVVLEK